MGVLAGTAALLFLAPASEASVLPQGLSRVRVLNRTMYGASGFTGETDTQNIGTTVLINAVAPIIDIGIFSDFTFSIGAPYVYFNEARFDANQFVKSKLYTDNYNKYTDMLIDKLIVLGYYQNKDIGQRRIGSGDSLPVDVDFTLPSTNEVLKIPANKPLQNVIKETIINAAKQSSGSGGKGDLELGARYQFVSLSPGNSTQAAITLLTRLPTGAFSKVAASQRAIGRGVAEVESTLGFDTHFTSFAGASSSLLMGRSVSTSKRSRQALLNSDNFASGKCNIVGTGNNPDGICVPLSNTEKVSREGYYFKTLALLGANAGVVNSHLIALGFNMGISYQRDNALVIDSYKIEPASLTSMIVKAVFDGTVLKPLLPIQSELECSFPVAGKNSLVALNQFTISLASFIKF